MKVLHTYCLNYNIGDYALAIGVKNLLRRFLDVGLIGETNIQGREFNKYYIHKVVNQNYDLLVIGGGGIIHGSHWPNGWFWLIDKELIKEIKIPFIIYGVGYNYWKEEMSIPKRAIEHLKETQKRAAYFSLRNDGSAERFNIDTGISAPAIPDPGFHVNLDSKGYSRKIKVNYVLIQVANDKPEYRFGDFENQKRFIENMREVTQTLSLTYKVIFAPHVYADVSLSKEIIKGIDNTEVWDFGYFAFDHVDQAIAYYKFADFVIAMRGHGQILPIAFGTPVISLENHPKHRGLMENLNLLEFNVDIKNESFVEILLKKIEDIKRQKKNLKQKLSDLNLKLLNNSEVAFSLIRDKIQSHGKY